MDGLTVRLAGSVGVSCGGSEPDGARLPGRKARRLLALLAAHRGRTVPNEVIVEELWGEAAPLGPVPAIATLVTRLRAALGPDVIRTGPDGYRLGAVRVDLPSMAEHVLDVCPTALASWYDRAAHAPFLEDPERFDRELADLTRQVNG